MKRFRNIGLLILLLLAGRMAAQVPVIDSVCSGAERFYRVSGETGSTYSWILTDPVGNVISLPSDADTINMIWNYPPGMYELQVMQHALNGCDADAVLGYVKIFEPPTVLAGPDSHICEDGSYYLEFATAEFTRSVLWETSGDGTFDNPAILNATYTPGPNDIINGTVTLTLTGFGLGDEGTCDPAVSSVVLTITENPDVSLTIVTDETEGLHNGSIQIYATGVTEHLSYTINNGVVWQTDNGLFTDLSAGTYYCIVKDENDCDTSFIIQINNILVTPLAAITGPDELCLGNMATVPVKVDEFHEVAAFKLKLSYNVDKLLCEGFTNKHPQLGTMSGTVDIVNGVITLDWQSDHPVSFSSLETIIDLVFSTIEAGQGELEWYATATESYFVDINGAPIPAEFFAGSVVIYQPPVVYVSDDLLVCEGQEVTITGIAQGINPPLHYMWTWPNGYTDSIQPHFESVTMSDAGYYTLLVTDARGCSDQKSVLLTVSETPVALFHGIDTLTVPPGYVLEAGSGMASYYWNTGDITENIIITQEGLYSVEMISWADCYGIDSIYIKMVPPECLYIPNAFTPNGDGLNDVFKAYTVCPLIYYRLLIFNRWGEKLFESNDINTGWDGTKDGRPCPGDAYVFMITYKVDEAFEGEAKYVKYGIVVILK